MAELKKNRRKIERCALEFYLIERCALWNLGRVFTTIVTHICCVTHMLAHFTQRSLSERMHMCHCCVLPLPDLLFRYSFDHSNCFFLNLHSTCRKDGKITGSYCLAARFHITSLHWWRNDTEMSLHSTEYMCVWTTCRKAVPHNALCATSVCQKRFTTQCVALLFCILVPSTYLRVIQLLVERSYN